MRNLSIDSAVACSRRSWRENVIKKRVEGGFLHPQSVSHLARWPRCLLQSHENMLAADKLLLRSTVKQRAIQLREKELTLFNENFNAVGTQSAVLAGFAMTSFAEIDLPHNAFYAQKVL